MKVEVQEKIILELVLKVGKFIDNWVNILVIVIVPVFGFLILAELLTMGRMLFAGRAIEFSIFRIFIRRF